jgi:hypothetical protein
MVRLTGLLVAAATVTGCTDIRDFGGTWSGPRVGDDPVLRAGFAEDAEATLVIDQIDLGSLRGSLTTSGDEFSGALIQELPAAEADDLSALTFTSGQPARIYVTLVDADDGGGDAVAFVSLHREDRVELRLIRGGDAPLYGIFFLERR